MNRDLLKFLSRLPHEELHESPTEALLVNYWACAAEQWNATHEPVYTTICDVEAAFRLRWPQIYGGINGSELYLSFSYIDYLFTDNEDGTVSGGIFKRGGEKPTVRLNMTPVQIVELAMALRVCPLDEEQLKENFDRYDHAEEFIEAYSRHEYLYTSHPMPESEALHQKAIHMEEKASVLYDMGYYEEALEWFQKSLITKRHAELKNGRQIYSEYAFQMMGICYDSLLDESLAETCYLYVYDAYYKRMLDKHEEEMQDAWIRLSDWACMYSGFLRRTGRPEEVERIKNLPYEYELKAIQSRLIRLLKNYQIEVESIDSVREDSITRFRLRLKPDQNHDIIRKLKCDIATSLGLKRVDVNITQDYAELVIPNSIVY